MIQVIPFQWEVVILLEMVPWYKCEKLFWTVAGSVSPTAPSVAVSQVRSGALDFRF